MNNITSSAGLPDNNYIGRSVERPNARRLLSGHGRYVDDLQLPRMVHAAFVRSPHAHAAIHSLDITAATQLDGVVAVYTGEDLARRIKPWVGVLTHLAGMRSAEQPALAIDRVRWQGEPVVLVVARTRAIAEDACALVDVSYDELPAVCDSKQALDANSPLIHDGFDSNLCWEKTIDTGPVDAAFDNPANTTITRDFQFGRHTGVTLESRATVACYDRDEQSLDFHYSGQAPHMMQAVLAKHLGLSAENVRVISRDVGGSFGIKIHTYGDEMAVAAAAIALCRPVKFVADRLESFQTDIHAREHLVSARLAVDARGHIQALSIDDLTGIGPYSMYPRSSGIEANQILNLTGAPYRVPAYRGRVRVVFQNKNLMCQYRAVGHPVAMSVMEGLMDDAAVALDLDPAVIRERNLIADDAYPVTSPTGMKFADLSHQRCLAELLDMINYESLKRERDELRAHGIYRGIGLASIVEVTNPSPLFYGAGGAPISAQDGATVRLDANGTVHVSSSITEQGQGTETILAQIAAQAMGVQIEQVKVTTGDTRVTPYGGGTWASRGAGIGGEAMHRASLALREQVLTIAAGILEASEQELTISHGHISVPGTDVGISLRELGERVYFRAHELPDAIHPELIATRHFRVRDVPFVFTNGAMASYVEVDTQTGSVHLLNHWVVEDCGTVINPKLVDEQIRGGVVQGIGGALFEECLYSPDGQLLNASLADYLVPMAAEMPDIAVRHVETPTSTSTLGAKGAGEAGTGGAPAAIMNAVNDALSPLGAQISTQPMTPERIVRSLGLL